MTRRPITAHEILQSAILGLLSASFIQSLVWLATGDAPPPWAFVGGGLALSAAVDLLIDLRSRREQQQIQQAYERPAFGEDT